MLRHNLVVRRLPWILLGVCSVAVLTVIALDVATTADGAILGIPAIGFAVMGALVAARAPGNTVGWIMLALGMLFPLQGIAAGVAGLVDVGSPPAGVVVAWTSNWLWLLTGVTAAVVLPLFFPDGRLPSRRWRPVLWVAAAGTAVSVAGEALRPGVLNAVNASASGLRNPVGIEGELVDAAYAVGGVLLGIAVVATAVSLAVRFRRSHGLQRQQVKWIAVVGVLMVVAFLGAIGVEFLVSEESSPLAYNVLGAIFGLSFLFLLMVALPAVIGIAILRHRLYDIDVVIRRTLVYGLLTAVLAGAYVGTVLLLQLAFNPVTEGSSLAVAGSTLAVAALFRPARRRVQEAVDRRFYRRKYDAERTLSAFNARLRDEVDLDALQAELVGIVRQTMQPGHVSLWLREAGR